MRFVCLLCLWIPLTAMSQDFTKHLWKDRLIVVYSGDRDLDKAKDQLALFRKGMHSLVERKVKVYEISNRGYRFNFAEEWQISSRKPIERAKFEVQLIGLDGGIKYRSEQIEPLKTFEQLIDAMPMRINELRNKSKNEE